MHPKYKAQVAVRGLAITIFSLTEEERGSERFSGLLKVTHLVNGSTVTQGSSISDIWPSIGSSFLTSKIFSSMLPNQGEIV